MKKNKRAKLLSYFIAAGLGLELWCSALINVQAAPIDYRAEAEARKSLPVETNEIEGWPDGPAIGAEGAILMEVNTGTILYAKNIHEKLYPASTTKILTALIASEQCDMDEKVYYSNEAVTSINWREDSNMGIKPDSVITMEQSLYGLMVGSANEAGNAIGEHISGSMEAFAELMTKRAAEIGCLNSNFVTTNGIFDEEHYTTPYDLGLIACRYFSNDLLSKMSHTANYHIPPSATQPDDINVHSKNELYSGKYGYEYLVGSKTGYTSEARQTLVSCAEKDGLKLVCVIMKEERPNQFVDTIDLFNYGFSNFKAVNISESDDRYSITGNTFFQTDNDIFGNSEPILTLDTEDYIVLPVSASYEDAESTLSYNEDGDGTTAATIEYTYNGTPVGTASVKLNQQTVNFDFEENPEENNSGETAAPVSSKDDSSAADDTAESTASETEDNSAAAPNSADENGNTALPAADGNGRSETDASVTDGSDAAETNASASRSDKEQENVFFVNIKSAVFLIVGIAAVLILIFVIHAAITDYSKAKRRREVMRRRRSRHDDTIHLDRYKDNNF